MDESISLKKTEDRLSWPLAEPGLGQAVAAQVVVKGFGTEPLLLLTHGPVKASRRSVWRIVQGYLTR